jgi:lipopolysaccharide/colanic/teichoic acid biosynthesis glycosyltransferase
MEASLMNERIRAARQNTEGLARPALLIRLADIAAAAGLVVVLTPVIVAVAALSYRPNLPLILRRQCKAPRGQRYTVYEFNAHDGRDSRHQVGRPERALRPLIRLFRGDQLPQLFNVIRGELSFFGDASRPRLFAD